MTLPAPAPPMTNSAAPSLTPIVSALMPTKLVSLKRTSMWAAPGPSEKMPPTSKSDALMLEPANGLARSASIGLRWLAGAGIASAIVTPPIANPETRKLIIWKPSPPPIAKRTAPVSLMPSIS